MKAANFTFSRRWAKIAKIVPTGDGELSVTGDLTIHGVTKKVVLKVESPTAEGKDPWRNSRMGASGTTKIKRSDFGLTFNAACWSWKSR